MTGADNRTILLECIDGKDDHFILPIANGQTLLLTGKMDDGHSTIEELVNTESVLSVTNQNGLLYIDATASTIPVKINGFAISTGTVKLNDLLRIGNSIWKPNLEASAVSAAALPEQKSLHQQFGGILGIEGLKDFKLKHIFSSVFKKHSMAEMEEQLVTGTSKNTPAITEIETDWARPWLFSRFLVLCIVISVLMVIGFRMYNNPNLVPGLIFVGAFAMPLATLIFFLEMNAPRNVSIFLVFLLLFIGGVASLLVTLLINDKFNFIGELFGVPGAALIEEPAKLLIVIFMMGKFVRYKWVLNGLLFGAAVGTGFGAFESAGYAFSEIINPLIGGNRVFNFDGAVDSIVLRGLLAPFMHVVWTANAAAALWLVKGERKLNFKMLIDTRFLRVLLSSIAIHFTWNSKFGLIRIPLFADVKYLLLGLISWTICFMLVQTGLKQLNKERQAEIDRLQAI